MKSSLSSAMALSRFRQVKSADEEANLLERAVPKSTRYKEPVGINMLNNILLSLPRTVLE